MTALEVIAKIMLTVMGLYWIIKTVLLFWPRKEAEKYLVLLYENNSDGPFMKWIHTTSLDLKSKLLEFTGSELENHFDLDAFVAEVSQKDFKVYDGLLHQFDCGKRIISVAVCPQ